MTWSRLADDDPFGRHNLPYGVFATPGGPHVGVRVGDQVLDLTGLEGPLAGDHSLDRLLGAGPRVWTDVRRWVTGLIGDPGVADHLHPVAGLSMLLPFTVADYVDFYSSEHHARTVGRIFRPEQEPLPQNWKSLPVGYHGRAGTVVVSGTEIVRPVGQRRGTDGEVTVGPSTRLDLEAELGFVVGVGTALGSRVGVGDLADHVFGVCVVNDWSARDLQAWEYVPLGPFLGKSFATSISPWIVPLAALEGARVAAPPRDTVLLDYLEDRDHPWGLDVTLTVSLNGEVVSRPPFAQMWWTAAQQLAHLTVNGASLRPGDLFASGTVSGPAPDQQGSLLELSWNGRDLVGATGRAFLDDGDEVVITAVAAGARPVGLGEVRGRIVPAR